MIWETHPFRRTLLKGSWSFTTHDVAYILVLGDCLQARTVAMFTLHLGRSGPGKKEVFSGLIKQSVPELQKRVDRINGTAHHPSLHWHVHGVWFGSDKLRGNVALREEKPLVNKFVHDALV